VSPRPATLSTRALNRATLQRQMLLERARTKVPAALEHLVGLQAQAPDAPYVGLWTRLDGFATDDLASLIEAREAVRAPLMRATVHLVTAADCAKLRPWVQQIQERTFASQPFARKLKGTDLDKVVDAGENLLAGHPMTRPELGKALAERWPDRDPSSLAYAVTFLLPTVQVPPRGVWGQRGPARLAAADDWTGRKHDGEPDPEKLILRYLGASGPASVQDVQAWSGLTKLREITDELGKRVRRFRDEDGRELLDLPRAPRPDPDTPAPPRFLPEYDNLLFSHADRSRVITGKRTVPLPPGNGGTQGTLLVDGLFAGTWKASVKKDHAQLQVTTFAKLNKADASAVTSEGLDLLAFIAPEGTPDVAVRHEKNLCNGS
jgi:hypothetical protein